MLLTDGFVLQEANLTILLLTALKNLCLTTLRGNRSERDGVSKMLSANACASARCENVSRRLRDASNQPHSFQPHSPSAKRKPRCFGRSGPSVARMKKLLGMHKKKVYTITV